MNSAGIVAGPVPDSASALNWYLKPHCHGHVLWCGSQLRWPDPLPVLPAKVRQVSPFRWRYGFNYCAFSYSLAWWDWPQWEQMIDWMPAAEIFHTAGSRSWLKERLGALESAARFLLALRKASGLIGGSGFYIEAPPREGCDGVTQRYAVHAFRQLAREMGVQPVAALLR